MGNFQSHEQCNIRYKNLLRAYKYHGALFTLTSKDIYNMLNWETKVIKIHGRWMLHFANDNLFVSHDIDELHTDKTQTKIS